MLRCDIELLIHKQLTKQLSSEEQAVLDAYLQADAGRMESAAIEAVWDASEHYVPAVQFDSQKGFKSLMDRIASEKFDTDEAVLQDPLSVVSTQKPKQSTKLFSIVNLSKVAAVFIVAIAGYLTYGSSGAETFTSGSETTFAVLEDGTSVWLAPHSSIDYSGSKDKAREVKLKGKAYFDVVRDEARPFSIQSDEITITVLGTSFTVDGFTGEVSVNTGKVAVASDTDAVTLLRGDKVSLDDSKFILGTTSQEDFDWVNPILKFDNTPLDQVLKELSLHFNVELSYKGRTDLSKCPFTATNLGDASLDQVLSVVKATYSMEVEVIEEGKSIVLSKVRCR